MRYHILTVLERRRIEKYLKANNGEKDVNIRQLILGYRRTMTKLKDDLVLLDKLLAAYGKR